MRWLTESVVIERPVLRMRVFDRRRRGRQFGVRAAVAVGRLAPFARERGGVAFAELVLDNAAGRVVGRVRCARLLGSGKRGRFRAAGTIPGEVSLARVVIDMRKLRSGEIRAEGAQSRIAVLDARTARAVQAID